MTTRHDIKEFEENVVELALKNVMTTISISNYIKVIYKKFYYDFSYQKKRRNRVQCTTN